MDQKRIFEIAAEFFPFLKGDNDAIAADPRRWGEKLESWSVEEATAIVAALINKAVNESLEEAAKVCDESCGYECESSGRQIRALKTLPQ